MRPMQTETPHPIEPGLPFTGPWLLAPMEGVTEPRFRGLVLAANDPAQLGGAFTEFVRVSDRALPELVLERHLGTQHFAAPVGLQLMGAEPELVAETAQRAVSCGAPLIDLNFGCPAKGALRGCAGSAMLRDPRSLAALIETVVRAVPDTPVTAKIRAGFDDDSGVEQLARAVEDGGARMLTVHCRTRAEAYQPEVHWERIARAVSATALPVCGNGGIAHHADLERMRRETGCRFAMVGHGALRDPWIFEGRDATRAEAARFLVEYAAGLPPKRRMTRIKQLLRHWTAGNLFGPAGYGAPERQRWLREQDPACLFEYIEEAARVAVS